jgi:hypothetical protein
MTGAEKRSELVRDIVKSLQRSDLSQADLTRKIAEEIEFVESARDHYDKFEFDAYPPPPSKAEGRRQADEFIDAASRTLAAFEAFSREYKAPLLDYLIRMDGRHHSRFTTMLREMIGIVERERHAFAPKRSGGGSERREEKQKKMRCARFAGALILKFHKGKPLSPGYEPYLRITALLYDYWGGSRENLDVRRACEQVFLDHYAHEQD